MANRPETGMNSNKKSRTIFYRGPDPDSFVRLVPPEVGVRLLDEDEGLCVTGEFRDSEDAVRLLESFPAEIKEHCQLAWMESFRGPVEY